MSWKMLSDQPLIKRLIVHADVILVFVFCLLVMIPLGENACHTITTTGFDAQNFFLWSYSASQGTIPLKDTFYLYGYLQYYRSASTLVFSLFLLLSPMFFTLVYALNFKRLFHSRSLALIALILFILLTQMTIGMYGVARYGLIIISALLTTVAMTRSLKQPHGLVLVGFLNGLILLAATAEGLYAIAISVILINFHLLSTYPFKRQLFVRLLQNNLALLVGTLIGLLPLLTLNTLLNNWSGYVQAIKDLGSLSLYAKADYLPTDRTQAMIFLSLWSAILILGLEFRQRARRIQPVYWYVVAVTLTALIAQQKNLVRSATGSTLFYISLLLFGLYAYGLKRLPIPRKMFLAPSTLIVITATTMTVAQLSLPQEVLVSQLTSWYTNPPPLRSQLCLINKADLTALNGQQRFRLVLEYLNQHLPQARVFPFPYAPIFYTFLKQTPAPYPNFYDGSSLFAQRKNIAYMETQPVDLFIYDLNALIFDSVPEFIRVHDQFAYFQTNFQPHTELQDFVIFTRTTTPSSWFNPETAAQYPALIDRLTRFDLGQLPRLEGLQHSSALSRSGQMLLSASTSSALNQLLSASDSAIWSEPVLLIKYPVNLNTAGALSASTGGELTTQASFRVVDGGDYLFRLRNLPQFHLPQDKLVITISPEPETLQFYDNIGLDLW